MENFLVQKVFKTLRKLSRGGPTSPPPPPPPPPPHKTNLMLSQTVLVLVIRIAKMSNPTLSLKCNQPP